MARADIHAHEQLVTLNVVVTRDGRHYLATPIDLDGSRLHALAYKAVNRYAAVQGAVREMLR